MEHHLLKTLQLLSFALPLSGGLAWMYPRMVIAITAILSILFLSCDYFSLTLSLVGSSRQYLNLVFLLEDCW